MSWKNVKLIFMREVRDQFRDRRTLFMVLVLPLLLYPALGIGMVQMTVLFTEQPRTVVVLGSDNLPDNPPLLEGEKFVPRWFTVREDVSKLRVVTDSSAKTYDGMSPEDIESSWEILQQSNAVRELIDQIETLDEQRDESENSSQLREIETRIEQAKAALSSLFAASDIQVLIIVPDGFGDHIQEINQKIADRSIQAIDEIDLPRPTIVRNSADEKSLIAYQRVQEAMNAWEQDILKQRLDDADLPQSLPTPVNADLVDLAQDDQISATVWSKLFPALLVLMAVTGAFYPAVDLAAGEKERGTMETLLICPASRTEIVAGKFLTVMLFSIATAVLNLLSLGMTGKYMASLVGGGATNMGDLTFPPLASLVWIPVLLIPLAALFSALCLSLATFARSSKEGQYYLTPLLTVTLGVTLFCLSPAVEMTPFYSIIPVMNLAPLMKGLLLSSGGSNQLFLYAIPVLFSSVGYSVLALWWAIDQFNREDVLFREAERFEVGLWFRQLMRNKENTPSFGEAALCFFLIMLLQFVGLRFMQDSMMAATDETRDTLMLKLLMIQQLVIIATPALILGLFLTKSFRDTFRLYWPSPGVLAAAVILPFALHPLSLELSASLSWFFPPLPESIQDVLKTMTSDDMPYWLLLLAFAVLPGICEETAFRGFILSGFSHGKRFALAICLSSLTFGIMHMVPQQIFNASLLGLVLGLIAVRGNSLLPCILFHVLYNGLEVTRSRFGSGLPSNFFFQVSEEGVRYNWPTLVVAGLIASSLIAWLIVGLNRRQNVTNQEPEDSSAALRRGSVLETPTPVQR